MKDNQIENHLNELYKDCDEIIQKYEKGEFSESCNYINISVNMAIKIGSLTPITPDGRLLARAKTIQQFIKQINMAFGK